VIEKITEQPEQLVTELEKTDLALLEQIRRSMDVSHKREKNYHSFISLTTEECVTSIVKEMYDL